MGLQLSIGQIPKDTTDPLDLMRLETLYEISWACDVALEILNDLLLYDKLENGLLSLVKEDVPILDFIQNCFTMFSVQLRAKNIQLSFLNQNDTGAIKPRTPATGIDTSSVKGKNFFTASKAHSIENQNSSPVPPLSPFISTCELTDVYSNTTLSSVRSAISNIGTTTHSDNQRCTINMSARSVKSFHTYCSDETKEYVDINIHRPPAETNIKDSIRFDKLVPDRRIRIDDCVLMDKSKLGQVIRNIM